MERIKPPVIVPFVKQIGMVETNNGIKEFSSVGIDDFSPYLCEGKSARVWRSMTILGIPAVEQLEKIHEFEKKRAMTRFLTAQEVREHLGIYLPIPKYDKLEINEIFDQIKRYRPESYKICYGRYGWEGDLKFHHEWDTNIFLNKSMFTVEFREKKKSIKEQVNG